MFDVCTTGDMALIGTIFKFLPHMRQHGCSIFFTAAVIRAFAVVKNSDAPMLMRVART
jgi:hypothetical protein